MEAKELQRLRDKYIQVRQQLEETISNSSFEVDVDGDAVDKLQGASLLRVQNILSKNNLLKLKALDVAIYKIDSGEYGDCEECGEPIGMKRLEVIPGVSLCILCAEKSEKHI